MYNNFDNNVDFLNKKEIKFMNNNNNRKLYGTIFFGNEASDYGKENGRLDYGTLSKAFNKVLNNDIMEATRGIGTWKQVHGFTDNPEEMDYDFEIFQYFIISDDGAKILKDWTDEIVFYNEALDMYVWGVTHYGTDWDLILTDIELNCDEAAHE